MRLSDYIALQQGLPEAPADGQIYGRDGLNQDWVVALTPGGAASLYEPIISPKNSAFNKNFGTLAGTVAEGNHTHSQYLTDAPSDGSYYARRNGAWQVVPTASGTDLGNTRNSTSVTVTSSTGNNTTLAAATTSLAGVMTAADKQKLDDQPTDPTVVNPGSSLGQMMRWNNSEWVPTSVIKVDLVPSTNEIDITGNLDVSNDIAGRNLIASGTITATGNSATDSDFISAGLSGSGDRNVYASSTGRLVAGTPIAAMAQLSHLQTLVNTLEAEGAISPAAAATLTTAFTP